MGDILKSAPIDPTGGKAYMYKKGSKYIVTIYNDRTKYRGFTFKNLSKKEAEHKYKILITADKLKSY